MVHVNNRKLARLAKLAGAPDAKAAGVHMEVRLGDEVDRGQPYCTSMPRLRVSLPTRSTTPHRQARS